MRFITKEVLKQTGCYKISLKAIGFFVRKVGVQHIVLKRRIIFNIFVVERF